MTEPKQIRIAGEIGAYGRTVESLIEEIGDCPSAKIYIDSPGGSSTFALNLFDFLRDKKHVAIEIGERCFSAAVTIALAGHDIACAPYSRLMIHAPINFVSGTPEQLRAEADELAEVRERIIRIICQRTERTRRVVEHWLSNDFYMTAQEALANGFVDRIIAPEPKNTAQLRVLPDPAKLPTAQEELFREFLAAFGKIEVRDKAAFTRELQIFLAYNVSEETLHEAACPVGTVNAAVSVAQSADT